jgi:hypothetical protein
VTKRLFEHQPPRAKDAAETLRAAQAALEAAALDDNARKLGELLGASCAVKPVQYTRERHGRWLIEHGRAGDDYVFQLHPLKAPTRPWQDVVTGFIAAMDAIFPRSVQIHYRRPDEQWQVKFFTITAKDVCRLPGWEPAVKKAIDALTGVDAWSRAGSSLRGDHSPPSGKRTAGEAPE